MKAEKTPLQIKFDEWETANEQLGEKNTYLFKRGISLNTQRKFGVGFKRNWSSEAATLNAYANGKEPIKSDRCIIPTSANSYIARAIDPNTPKEYKVIKTGAVHILKLKESLEEAKETQKPIFIVEGEIDAMSIYEVGGLAIGLGGVGNIKRLTNELKDVLTAPYPTFICALDNDQAGQKSNVELAAALKSLGIHAIKASLFKCNYSIVEAYNNTQAIKEADPANLFLKDDFKTWLADVNNKELTKNYAKDVNDCLVRDPEELVNWLALNEEQLKITLDKETKEYSEAEGDYFDLYITGKTQETYATPTGFNQLDELLGGGLQNRVYGIGAVSSLGKSTLILQMAVNIARSGRHVLFFALEMNRTELYNKILSLLTLTEQKSTIDYARCRTQQQVANEIKAQKGLTSLLVNTFRYNILKYLHIIDFEKRPDIAEINGKIETFKRCMRAPSPVIFLDYLQLLKAPEEFAKCTDKQIVDENMFQIKQISQSEKLPIVFVSSFSRANYTEEASTSSFKESGAIEYDSDVIITLQLAVIRDSEYMMLKSTESSAKRRKIAEALKGTEIAPDVTVRHLILQIQKNRSGRLGGGYLEYIPKYNHFKEIDELPKLTPKQETATNIAPITAPEDDL